MAVDGTVFDVPDTEANARVFGYPASLPGTQAAFAKVRLVFLYGWHQGHWSVRSLTSKHLHFSGERLGDRSNGDIALLLSENPFKRGTAKGFALIACS